MKRGHVSWSNFTDYIEGPCAVCGVEVRFVIPADRPDPSLLYHATCDVMGALREHLKTATPPPLPIEYTVLKTKAAAPSPASESPRA